MTKKIRYFLIFICIAVFFILAPLIIFYVRGISYNGSDNKILQTGILSARTEPKGVKIYLDDQLKDTTPADIRFLKAGGYNLKLVKDGYFDWTKRIQIAAGKVTWLTLDTSKIFLFLRSPIETSVATGVLDFYKLPSGWLYLTTNNLVFTQDDAGLEVKNIALPKPVQKVSASPDSSLFLLESDKVKLLFNLNTQKFTQITDILKNATQTQFDGNNNLWALKGGQLVRINPTNLQQAAIQQNVASFQIQASSLYYLKKSSANTASLFLASISDATASDQPIASSIPIGKSTQILITEQKEIFVLEDGSLYRINASNEKLMSGVLQWSYDSNNDNLVFATASELNFYNFSSHLVQLITRSSDGFTHIILNTQVGYAFYNQNKNLIAAETDTLDHQNAYTLASLSGASKFSLDAGAKQIYLLDNGNLKSLTIR